MSEAAGQARGSTPFEVFVAFLRLGVTCFGGPIAHIGYFRDAFVEKRGWLGEAQFAQIVALCQLLPGPASSQVGFAIGLRRAGALGGLAAWLGFTMPSALLMLAFAYAAPAVAAQPLGVGVLHGLKLAAVAVVAQAAWSMARSLAPDRTRAAIAAAAAAFCLFAAPAVAQIGAICAGAVAGLAFCRSKDATTAAGDALVWPVSRAAGLACIVIVAALFVVGLADGSGELSLFGAFYRSGALVFGGGHVVLPLLRGAVVSPGWVSQGDFLSGYGAAQALPGPLFSFAAFLGAVSKVGPGGAAGGVIALVGIFLPGLLLVVAAIPFWSRLQRLPLAQASLRGVNAAVVGILAAALYDPVWTTSVTTHLDFAVALAATVLLTAWRAPPLVVVALCAVTGAAMGVR
ncbi:MAG: chromate efflux transporter [Caulobacterales bacterium]